MQKYSDQLIRRWTAQNLSHYHYKPFPGKNPVRLLVVVRDIRYGVTGRVVFRYHGKYSPAMLRQGLAKQAKLATQSVISSAYLVVYCQSGVLYRGNFSRGSFHRNYNMAFSGFHARDTRSQREGASTFWDYSQAVTPLKLGKYWTLCLDPLPMPDSPDYRPVVSRIRRQYLMTNGGYRFAGIQDIG